MALLALNQMVRARLPYLTQADLPVVDQWLNEAFITMQLQTGKTDQEVFTPEAYSPVQQLFFAAFTAKRMLNVYLLERQTGREGGEAAGKKFLKKAVADVVTAEFEQARPETDFDTLLTSLQSEVCLYAKQLGYKVDGCNSGNKGTGIPKPFTFFNQR